MNFSQAVLNFARTTPGATSRVVAEKFKKSVTQASVALGDHARAGRLERRAIGKSLTNQTRYGYWPASGHSDVTKSQATAKPAQAPKASALVSLDDIMGTFVEQLADQLVAAVITNIKPRLEEKLRLALPAALPQITQQAPKPKAVVVERTTLPRVCVTGLLPQQAGIIQSEFHDTFDISFWNDIDNDNLNQLRVLGTRCEAVFFHTPHAAHKTQELLKSVGANVIPVGGGVSSMRDALTKYYVEQS